MPTKEEARLRDWAVDVLNKYSGVQFSDSARADVVNRVALPTPAGAGGGMAGFQGALPADSRLRLVVSLDATASGPTIVVMGFSEIGGTRPTQQTMTVSPGASNSLELTAGARGLLRILLDSSEESSGTVQLLANDRIVRHENFRGDTSILFSVDSIP